MKDTLAKNTNFDDTINYLQNLSLVLKTVKNEIKILVESKYRSEVMLKIKALLEPKGFIFANTQKSSIGVLKKIDRKNGSVYVYVKPIKQNAAVQGYELEKKYCRAIKEKFSFLDIEVKNAGASDGADIDISKEDKSVSIELKRNVCSDYGQFGVVYDLKEEIWIPNQTKNYYKNKNFIDKIFHHEINQYLNCFCNFEGFESESLIIKEGKIKGISGSGSTNELKKSLEKVWFGNQADFCLEIDKSLISNYYFNKGNKFIQVENMGLYILENDAKYPNMLNFIDAISKSYLRFRIKSHGGKNSRHSFTVAIKLELKKSHLNLLENDMFKTIIEREFVC